MGPDHHAGLVRHGHLASVQAFEKVVVQRHKNFQLSSSIKTCDLNRGLLGCRGDDGIMAKLWRNATARNKNDNFNVNKRWYFKCRTL